MSTSSSNFEVRRTVDRLNDRNYNSWKFRMEILLKKNKTWIQVTSSLADDATAVQKVAWSDNDAKALHDIVSELEENQLVHIKQCTTAKETWEKLKRVHQKVSLGSQIRVMRLLFTTHFHESNETMMDHLNRMTGWLDSLVEMGSPFDELQSVGIILSSVSEEYDHLVTALDAWDVERRTLHAVKEKLLDEYEKRKAGIHEVAHFGSYRSSTNLSRGRGRYSSMRGVQRAHQEETGGFKCHHCQQPGHFRRNCPDLQRYREDLRGKLNEKVCETKEENKNYESAKVARSRQWYESCFYSQGTKKTWCIDSGATSHMCGMREIFFQIDLSYNNYIVVANGERAEVRGKGKVKLFINTDKGQIEVEMNDVLWIPTLSENLVSVFKLTALGKKIEFEGNKCFIHENNQRLCIAVIRNGLYILSEEEKCFHTDLNNLKEEFCVHEWHRRLAHRNLADIRAMRSDTMIIKECDHSDICESCIKGKMSRQSFPKVATPTQAPLDCVVSDVCGPMQTESLGKKRYFITFTDLFSKYTFVYGIRGKNDVVEVTINFMERMKTQFNKKVKVFRSDRGTEYLNIKLATYFDKEGIETQCTVGYAPEQNGVAERKNRTLMEATRSMLNASNLPKSLWGEALSTANYVFNRVENKKTKKSPYELLNGSKPTQTKFYEFGCDVYVMVPKENRRKLDDKAVKMKFVGYDEQAKGYRLINSNFKIHVSREVKFLSSLSSFESSKVQEKQEVIEIKNRNDDEIEEEFYDAEDNEGDSNDDEFEDSMNEIDQSIQQEESDDSANEEDLQVRRSQRSTAGIPPRRYDDFVAKASNEDKLFEPLTLNQALNCPQSENWMNAMKEELTAINENKTWEISDLPAGRKAIGSKWVYKLKLGENNQILRYKARLVAQGFSQKFGVDYDEVFAPVIRSTTFRLLLSIAGQRNYKVNHYDIKTAFLNGTLEEEIFMKQPPGFENGDKVLKLRKSLYGLKQAARVWNQTLHNVLINNSWKQNQIDKCLYEIKQGTKVCYFLVHVDDILTATNDDEMERKSIEVIGKNFELKNLGRVNHFLGIDVTFENGKFFISQSNYIDKIVSEAQLNEGKTSKFPLDVGYYKQEGNILPSNDKYRKIIGMLLYLTTNTRPDIAASVSILSKKVEKPRNNDLTEVMRVVRYLKGTKDLRLQLNGMSRDPALHAYSDANWAEDRGDRKSNSGFYCTVYGGTISWSSRKQDIIALSSTEAEYVALSETCKELIWLIELAKSLDIDVSQPVTVYTDSQSCMSMISNHKFSHRTKHIDIKFHFVRDQVTNGKIQLTYVPTEQNIADMMTKPLGSVKMQMLRQLAGLHSRNEEQQR